MAIERNTFLKCIMILIVFFCIFGMVKESAFGASVPYSTGVVNDAEGVNIRSSYTTESSVVVGAPYQGAVLITKERFTSNTSTAKSTRWFYVQSGYGNGWIRSDFLDVSYGAIEGKVNNSVNIRKGAGTSFDAVSELKAGDTVDVKMVVYSTEGVKWYKIYYNKYYRFVHSKYVDLQEPVIEEGAEAPVLNENFEAELASFPASYHDALKALHEKYPTWHFKANVVDYTWEDALAKQMAKPGINTIPSSKPDSYKAVTKDTYNFNDKYYYSFDGSSWLAASKKAVAYYMDPRNWLDEISVFMFESLSFDPDSQKESMVKGLLASTAIPTSYSTSYMTAAATYNISPVYLAAKTKLELGSSSFMVDGHEFTYNGKTYKGFYNVYNIGASDSASGSAALKGLYYAASGSSYLRPWNTLDKAIRGGAKFIAEDFVGNNQHTAYYEHFNVANGLDSVGTHVYMTNTMAAATHANITYWDYHDNKLLDTGFTFEIPVFQTMPASASPMPGSGNNNCYLDSVTVYNGSTKLSLSNTFDRFTTTHTLKNSVGLEVKELTIKAVTNASDAKVSITGNTDLKVGENKIKVKVTSSAGVVKTYYIKVNKLETSTVVFAPEITLNSDAESGKTVISWKQATNADEYKVYRNTTQTGTYKLLKTTTDLSYVDSTAVAGTKYYYKVKSVGKTDVVGEAVSESKYRTCDLPRPVVTSSNQAADGNIKLSWNSIEGASQYSVYRGDTKNGTYKKIGQMTEVEYVDQSEISAGTTYYYKILALHEKEAANSAYSVVVSATRKLPQPVITGTTRESDGKPELSWEGVPGAVKYEVYRSEKKNGTYKRMIRTVKKVYANTSAVPGTTYYYKVKAVPEAEQGASAFSKVLSVKCGYAPLVLTVSNQDSNGKPLLTWNTLEGAENYEVYRSFSEDGTFKKLKTTTNNSHVHQAAEIGTSYYYKVTAYGKVSEDGSPISSEVVSGICVLPQPVVTLSNRPSDGKIKVSWDAVEDANKYDIYYATSKTGNYKKLIAKTTTSHVHQKSEPGKKYYYKVKAVNTEIEGIDSAFSQMKYRICDLPRPEITVSLNSKTGKPKVSWKKVEGAESYVVYYATSKSGTYKKLSTKTGTTCTHSKAVEGKTYYYKVKGICPVTSNGNSVFSVVKGIKSK